MSLPLLARLTGGIPPAEFSWVRAAAPRAKTEQQIQSFEESAVFRNQEWSHPLRGHLAQTKVSLQAVKVHSKGWEIPPLQRRRGVQLADGTCS